MKTRFLNEQMMVLNWVIADYDKDSQTPLLSSLELLYNILKKWNSIKVNVDSFHIMLSTA